MSNIHQTEDYNKQVVQVWTEQPGFTGYQALDFTKLDDLETYTSGVASNITGINSKINDIKSDINSIDSKIYVTGDDWPNGVKGTQVFQADLSQQFDAVTIFEDQSSGINNFTPTGLNGTILTTNPFRKELYIQNLSTGILYVKYGLGANASSFNFVLSRCSEDNAADGGSLSHKNYVGDVSVSGTSLFNKYIYWERSSSRVLMSA